MKKILLLSSAFVTILIIVTTQSCKKKTFSPSCSGGTPSYNSAVKALIQSKCVSCHSSYATYTGISSDVSRIRATIIDGSMPKNGSLTDDEKNKIICWIDGGNPNN